MVISVFFKVLETLGIYRLSVYPLVEVLFGFNNAVASQTLFSKLKSVSLTKKEVVAHIHTFLLEL